MAEMHLYSIRRNNIYPHPGIEIRELILKNGLSVTDAAKKLGVGRIALSGFLNGRCSLSIDMSLRIEEVFGIPTQKFLIYQLLNEIFLKRNERNKKSKKSF